MRTKFILSEEYAFEGADYITCFTDHGWIVDEEHGEIYKIYDREINLQPGDQLEFVLGYRQVQSKCFEIDEDMVVYYLDFI